MTLSLPGCRVTTVIPRSFRSIDMDLQAALRAALLQPAHVCEDACMWLDVDSWQLHVYSCQPRLLIDQYLQR